MEHDARAAIDLYGGHKNPASLKSSWYLAQALVGLQRPQEAYDVAIDGYRASLAAQNVQTENLSKIVLRAKQQIWAAKETSRLRELNATLGSVEQLIEADLNRGLSELEEKLQRGEIGEIGCREDQKALREDAENNINNVREAFRIASKGEVQERVNISPLLFYFQARTACLNNYLRRDDATDWIFCRLFPTTSSTGSPLRSCTTQSSHHQGPASTASELPNTCSSRGSTPSRGYR